jgi:glycopeptide antibiotics resistance protein
MTTRLLLVLKKWALPILVVYALTLAVFSLIRLSDIPGLGFSFDDKIYHFVAYFIFTGIAYNFFRQTKLIQSLLIASASVTVYGIIIEVLQLVMTTYRTLDVYDIIANTLGALVSAFVLQFLNNSK